MATAGAPRSARPNSTAASLISVLSIAVFPSAAAAAGAAVGGEIDPDLGTHDDRRLAADGPERLRRGHVRRHRRDGVHGLLQALQLGALGGGEDPPIIASVRSSAWRSPERLDGGGCPGVRGERIVGRKEGCLLYTSPSPRDGL